LSEKDKGVMGVMLLKANETKFKEHPLRAREITFLKGVKGNSEQVEEELSKKENRS